MNLYSSSIRVCFLLFESMRVHLKFQLEVTSFYFSIKWSLGLFVCKVTYMQLPCAELADVPKKTDGHHHIREHEDALWDEGDCSGGSGPAVEDPQLCHRAVHQLWLWLLLLQPVWGPHQAAVQSNILSIWTFWNSCIQALSAWELLSKNMLLKTWQKDKV